MVDYGLVLKYGWSGKWKSINGNDPEQIVMREGEPPSKKELDDYWKKHGGEIQKDRERKNVDRLRRIDYEREADPLFFQYQAGEATKEEWQEKRQEIKERYPKPD